MTTAPDPGLAARRLERWKLSLLDLTFRNRLLDARDGRQVVTVAGDPVKLAAALDAGHELELVAHTGPSAEAVGGPERVAEAIAHAAGEALAARKLLVAAPATELERSLVAMSRAARESLREGGARTLWFGLGVLRWFETGQDQVARHAPLLLVPAELKRIPGTDRFRVAAVADEEARWNETLLEKLRTEHRLDIPRPAGDDEPEVAAVMGAVTSAVDVKPGWQVLAEARLGIFSFTKFAMWTDLAQRGEALLSAPVVQHLAAGDGRAFPDQGAFLDPGELDRVVPLGELFAPLDADASQLVAVMAGAAGRSFVLQGPPGTGKSQTITNLIAQALATGKTVLFVAEKIAALEVVERRLAAVGLGDFCLELHSHKARKREVIGELGRVLERVWRPNTPVAGDDERLAAVRTELDEYADALHRPQPAGPSVHDALARLGELRDAPKLGPAAATAQVARPEDVAARREAVARLAETAVEVTPPTAHPWRGSTLDEWKLSSEDAVAAAVGEARAAAAALADEVARLPSVVPGLEPRTRAELEAVGALADKLTASPRPGAELIIDARPASDSGADAAKVALVKVRAGAQAAPKDVGGWLALERYRREQAARLEERWTRAVYEPALTGLADTFRSWADRFALFRWFALRGPRKAARKALASGALPGDAAVADDLDRAREVATLGGVVEAARPAARRWLGALAAAAEPDAPLEPVDAAEAWARELRAAFDKVGVAAAAREQAWRAVVAIASDPAGAAASMESLARAVVRWREARAALTATCGVDVADGADGRHLPAMATATAAWAAAPGALRAWTAYARAKKAALAAGLGPLVERFEAGELAPDQLAGAWERAMLVGVAEGGLAASPVLAGFHGAAHHARVAELGELDRAQLKVAQARAIARLSERVPRVVPGQDIADTGEIGKLLHELKKQRRHKPLRTLFREIPTLLTRLKPCLLMSPLSVAQYLDPAISRFDLVIFDEASQIPTADAIGALARGEAAVIVGDSRQLPPTRFFAVGDGRDGDGAPDADEDVEELESVLDECVAARLPELRLRWHYRSRHEDLIAFSNDRYYGGNLDVFPAAAADVAELGVSLRRVPGVYDRAGTRQNRTEAEAVVADVKARLLDPEQARRSLAVVTFSRPQQELILDLLDEERQKHPELEPFFSDEATDPVLVKNLETIQGDERDVVLFSIGYGPDRDGKVTMNFGPLGKDGGERRLNVAVTRAREQLVVFSSIDAEHIREDVTAAGVRHLRELLAYARDGGPAASAAAARPPATRLTAAIGAALEAKSWTVHHQVGCAGYRLDLAVVDPDDPGRYVLALETDGPAYASARTARDRDRLRALVLGNLGWRLHRIWSLDWWHDADKELQRANNAVINAVAKARAARKPAGATKTGPVVAPVPVAAGSGSSKQTAPVLTPAARPAAAEPTSPTAVNDAPTSPTPIADLPTVPTAAPVGSAAGAAGAGSVPSAGAARPVRSTRAPVRIDGPIEPPPSQPASPVVRVTRPMTAATGGPQVLPYQAASLPPGRRTPDDLYDAARTEELGNAIEKVLAVEAPISLSLLSRRVGAYFGVGRITDKVEGRVREVAAARAKFGTGDDGDVVWRKDQNPSVWPPVRVPGNAAETRRDAAEVPVAEIASATLVVLSRNLGMGSTDLHKETAKLLGFARYTDKVQARMKDGLVALISRGACQVEDGHVSLP